MDREKVIKDNAVFELQSAIEIGGALVHLRKEYAKAILALLQEQKTGQWVALEFCANEGIYCSECHMKIFDRITKPKQKLSQYCPHCGSKNEHFYRDGEIVFM